MADGSGIPNLGAQAATVQQMLGQQALAYGGVTAAPQIQNAAMAADMLQQLSERGGENSRTPLAMGLNLMAELLQRKALAKDNAALYARIGSGMQGAADAAQRGIYGPDSGAGGVTPESGAAGGGAGYASPAAASPSPSPFPGAAAAPGGGTGGDLLTKIASDPPPSLSGSDFFDSFFAPHEGALNPKDANGAPSYWGINAKANGLTGPITRPQAEQLFNDRYFVPSGAPGMSPGLGAMAADTYALNPSWERQAMATAGGDPAKFMAARAQLEQADLASNPNVRPYAKAWANRDRDLTAYAQTLGFGQPVTPPAPGGGPSAGAPAPGMPTPSPIQIATGPGPTVPGGGQAPSGGAPVAPPQASPTGLQAAAPSPAPMPGGGAAPPPQGPPTGAFATPQERAFIQFGLQHPRGSIQWNAAMQKAQEIQQRAMTPMAPPKDMMWGPNGQAVPLPGTQFQNVSQGPAGVVQADPFGKLSPVSNPNAAPPPAGSFLTPGPGGTGVQVNPYGGFGERPATPAELQAHGAPPGASATINAATGEFKMVNPGADLKTLQASRDSWRNSDETKKANEAISAYNGIVGALGSAAAKNNGVVDTAAVDSYLRGINPGMGARNATVQMFLGHLGLPAELEGHINSLVGNGYLTPQTINQMLGVIRAYAQAHGQVAGTMAQNDLTSMPKGVTMDQLGETLPPLSAPPNVQWLGGGQAPAQAPVQAVPGAPPGFDPASPNGRVAMQLIQGHGYRFQNGQLVDRNGRPVQ